MTKSLTYVIGAPGVGKSTAVAAAIRLLGWGEPTQELKPFAHQVYGRYDAVQLGKQADNGFPGTDTLSLGVNPKAVEFISNSTARTVIAEGDRLANRRFLEAAATNYAVSIVTIHAPLPVMYERMLERAAQNGTPPQKESWWNGRYTKTQNLRNWTHPGVTHLSIDGTAPPSTVAACLAKIILEKGRR